MPRPGEVIRRGLAGRVRRTRVVGRFFSEVPRLSEFTVDLIGRHVEKSKGVLLLDRQIGPVGPRCLQKSIRSKDVGANKCRRTVDRAIDVRLRRQMKDCIGLILPEQAFYPTRVGNVSQLKLVAVASSDRFQVGTVSSVGECVDGKDVHTFLLNQVPNDPGSNESCSTSHQHHVARVEHEQKSEIEYILLIFFDSKNLNILLFTVFSAIKGCYLTTLYIVRHFLKLYSHKFGR